MAIIKKSMIAALGLLAVGSITSASASPLASANAKIAVGDAASLQLVTDRRGSWVEPRTRWRGDHDFKYRRGYSHYDDHHHYKKKKFKKKKVAKRAFKKGYGRGYDQGYRDARRYSRLERRHHRHHRHYYPSRGFRGGIVFGDGYFSGGGFRFRY